MPNKYNHLLLQNKVCVVTGAASLRSIGYATAELFAAHGAKLVLLDLLMNDKIEQEIRKSITDQIGFAPELLAISCDIVQKNDCDKAIEKAIAYFGREGPGKSGYKGYEPCEGALWFKSSERGVKLQVFP